MLVVSALKKLAGMPAALLNSKLKYCLASFNCNLAGSNPSVCNSTSAFKNAVDLVDLLAFHDSNNLVIRSGVKFVPFDFNTIVGTGSLAYNSAAFSNSNAALIVRPARFNNPSSSPLNTTKLPIPYNGTSCPSTL